jgi:transglutaminase-like putative cysteine protease
MIIEVQHETRLAYNEPVTESVTEIRMEPVSDADQSCRSFHLAVSPGTPTFRFLDGFGNSVHHFSIMGSHAEVQVLAASVVETHPRPRGLADCPATWPLREEDVDLRALDCLPLRGPTRSSARLAALVEEQKPVVGERLADVVTRVRSYIHGHFRYAQHATLASSPIDDVLEQGKGVCQDFSHLMIAMLRAFGIPARYVSGYIHRPGKDSQSHAWCEVWLPEVGWIGMDPTNDCVAHDHFVKVGVGRDFTDVPPNKGIFRGKASESILVRVETRTRDTLPSLSWQEQLPPLHVPLTAMLPARRQYLLNEDDHGQQQQQQQQ